MAEEVEDDKAGEISSAQFLPPDHNGAPIKFVEVRGQGLAVSRESDLQSRTIDGNITSEPRECSDLGDHDERRVVAMLAYGLLPGRRIEVRLRVKRGRTGGETTFSRWVPVSRPSD